LSFARTINVKTIKLGELRGDFGAIRQALSTSFRVQYESFPRSEPFSQEIHLKILYGLEDWVKYFQMLNHVVESHLFTFLWNRYPPMTL
jgi:hypothetical protein